MHPSSFCNYNHVINHSKPSQVHYHPHYNNHLEDQHLVHEIFQQPLSNDNNHHGTVIEDHENSHLKTSTNVQSTLKKYSGYNNGKFVPTDGGDQFINKHVIMKNDCLAGKISSKKDRHSKINTAQGPRDRRMRLSLDVAKKFFRLQDMLGFDKASNTVEWLLMKSKPGIRDLLAQKLNQSCCLIGLSNTASSGSECEVLSGIDYQCVEKTGDDNNQVINVTDKPKLITSCSNNKEKKRVDRIRKSVFIHQSLAKETREKARARARKRTTEKRNTQLIGCDQFANSKPRPSVDRVMDQDSNRLGSWVLFGENHDVQKTDQIEYPSAHFQFEQGIVGDNSSLMSTNWSPSILFNDHHNFGPSHEHQFSDFPIMVHYQLQTPPLNQGSCPELSLWGGH